MLANSGVPVSLGFNHGTPCPRFPLDAATTNEIGLYISHLGFNIDTVAMQVTREEDKLTKLKAHADVIMARNLPLGNGVYWNRRSMLCCSPAWQVSQTHD